jgi:O-Antigen ligase
MVLTVGALGVLAATGYLRIPLRDEPVLLLLAAFFLWGLIWLPSGYRAWGINAVRDFALCYYCFFAFFTVALLARAPEFMDRWLAQLNRFIPWLLLYLPVGLILAYKVRGPSVPFSGGVPILSHAPGNCAIAAVLALGYMWLFPQAYSARSRALYSIVALVVVALSATQNRGGLLGALAGAVVGLAFLPGRTRLRLIVRAAAVIVLGLGIAVQLSVNIPTTAGGRAISVSQLVKNVTSIGAAANTDTGTVGARDLLWSLIYQRQVTDGKLVDGFGWGVNLPLLVNDTQVTSGADPLRSPHNSHDDVLARLGLIGLSLWIAMWLGWYWRMVAGCQRLARRGMHAHRQVAVLCMITVTAILVSAFFAPQLEGAQVAALMWTAFGVGVAVTSRRGWFRWPTPALDTGAGIPDDRE